MSGESNDVRHISAFRKPLAAPRLQSQVHELDVMSFFLGNGREDLQNEWLVDTEKHHVVQLWKQQQDAASHVPSNCNTSARAESSDSGHFRARAWENRPPGCGKIRGSRNISQ